MCALMARSVAGHDAGDGKKSPIQRTGIGALTVGWRGAT
jgi:hypothetical protein